MNGTKGQNPRKLLGISNAIVDVLAHVDDEFLQRIEAPPGSMTLIDEARAREIYAMMGPATELSGGSVANTVAGFANLGGPAAYIGRVKNDQLGEIFVHDMQSIDVDVRLEPAIDGAPTARSHILITADGQRTMQTYLGACTELSLSDVTAETLDDAGVVLLEGYVWDIPEGPALAAQATQIAHSKGGIVALSLSDSFCVERHQAAFHEAIKNGVDMVFGNEKEIIALLETDSFESAIKQLSAYDNLFVLTRSEKGSVIVKGDQIVTQAAMPISNLVDTTGAGDAYTAGFLYGWTTDQSFANCAKLGTFCATQVIQQLGARIEKGLLEEFSR